MIRRIALILALVILIVGTVFISMGISRLNTKILDLQVALSHSETRLAMVTDSLIRADAALKAEKAKTVGGEK